MYGATVQLQSILAQAQSSSNEPVARQPDLPTPVDDAVTRAVVLDASRSAVWAALTVPEELSEWLGGRVEELDLRPEGRGVIRRDDGATRRVRVVSVEPPVHLTFRWWPFESAGTPRPGAATRVEIRLAEHPDGTLLTVTERAMPGSAFRLKEPS